MSGSNAGTLYGKGIYLAENATKSDEYGEGPKGPASTGEEAEMGFEAPRPPPGPPPPLVRESYILVCRSALGRVNYNDEQRPDPDRLQKSCLSGEFDSVLGDRLKLNRTFREIIVYNDDHVYPEYIVKAMLDRSLAGRFSGPTKEEGVRAVETGISEPTEEQLCSLQEWDRKGNGKIDWDDFLAEVTQRVRDKISCSGPERFAEIYRGMLDRKRSGRFDGPDVGERAVLRMVWYQYCQNQRTIDKQQLLLLLKAINQPPANERDDLDETFKEIDTKNDGVIVTWMYLFVFVHPHWTERTLHSLDHLYCADSLLCWCCENKFCQGFGGIHGGASQGCAASHFHLSTYQNLSLSNLKEARYTCLNMLVLIARMTSRTIGSGTKNNNYITLMPYFCRNIQHGKR
ncbi:unnamed protein product [Durusdinium trenchii]|uniref:PARP catalytic domain-containing protein n=1 Tax=Durusdinium trenchii TaxID=1381693 RepID=A0ABP0LUL4_9DINO